jgi:hypothetical protein
MFFTLHRGLRKSKLAVLQYCEEIKMRISVSILFSACIISGCFLPLSAHAQSADQLAGSWGLAAYWKPSDAKAAQSWARAACSQPYVIKKGQSAGTVLMHIADDPVPHEVQLLSRQGITELRPMAEVPGGVERNVRTLSDFDGKSFQLIWQDSGVAARYGTNVYVKCAR